jgi:DNA-binding winged helix-turn-helix (wHTH) protein
MKYLFSNCEVHLARFELCRAGNVVTLEPQAFDLLVYLIEQRDRVVLKRQILDQFWNDRVVSDATLSHYVMAVRKAVGDDGRLQSVIKTHHRRGYRFIAPVTVIPGAQAVAGPSMFR